jgi:hypothetical protein
VIKKIVMFAVLLCCVSLSFSSQSIVISPDSISSPAPAPTVCISGFKPNTIVIVMLPSFSYGFIVSSRGQYCHTPDYLFNLDAGKYDVPSIVCNYEAGSIPTKCKNGPSESFLVN